MEFTDKELINLYKAVKILENGEGLLGIDIDKDVVGSLAIKLKQDLSKKTISLINGEIEELIHEAEMGMDDYIDDSSEYDFDREFGPSYPTSETMKVLNKAIEDEICVEIDYYSLSQGKFTKRKIEPESIERRSSKAYLNAFCHLRNEDRVFRVDRIKRIEVCE